jgi:anti-anti-sigma factor
MAAQFQIEQRRELDGGFRLTLLGELDMSVAEGLEARLRELKGAHASVRLDLSQLSFIDSTGIRIVTLARLDSGRNNGWQFEVEPELNPAIRRPLELLGLDRVLWSETPD